MLAPCLPAQCTQAALGARRLRVWVWPLLPASCVLWGEFLNLLSPNFCNSEVIPTSRGRWEKLRRERRRVAAWQRADTHHIGMFLLPLLGPHPQPRDHHSSPSAETLPHADVLGVEDRGMASPPVWARGLTGEGARGPWRLQGALGASEGLCWDRPGGSQEARLADRSGAYGVPSLACPPRASSVNRGRGTKGRRHLFQLRSHFSGKGQRLGGLQGSQQLLTALPAPTRSPTVLGCRRKGRRMEEEECLEERWGLC